MFTKIHKNLFTTHPTEIAFMVRDVMTLKGIFSIFPLAGCIKFMVYLQICSWILKQVGEVSFKPREKFAREGWEDHFEVKLRSEEFHLDFQNIFQNKLCWKVYRGVCILKIVRIYSFTGALKTHVLLFQKIFQIKIM